MKCRNCSSNLNKMFVDLGTSPSSNSYITKNNLLKKEKKYPLKVFVCENCWLVQTQDFTKVDQLFDDNYAYFSSTSKSFLNHAKSYALDIIDRIKLKKESLVIEVASNDGYLLKNFLERKIPCLGIEPTKSTADFAKSIGIPVIKDFFSSKLADKLLDDGISADLICGNNVYAHVPNINDFTLGLKKILKKSGTITLEFPHILQLIKFNQFDTIYHEHFSYLSLYAVNAIFKKFDLRIYRVEELGVHGGSLRIYGCHNDHSIKTEDSFVYILKKEILFGINRINIYEDFQKKVKLTSQNFLNFLNSEHNYGKKIAAYGAAAKGNTILNYLNIKDDKIMFVCDAAKSKQNKYMPGSHIPILSPEQILIDKPDFVIIFPWNLSTEIKNQLEYIREWGGKFVVAIPELKIL